MLDTAAGDSCVQEMWAALVRIAIQAWIMTKTLILGSTVALLMAVANAAMAASAATHADIAARAHSAAGPGTDFVRLPRAGG